MITVLAVGRARPPLADAIAEYEARASRYWKLSVVEVDAGVGRGGRVAPEDVRDAEGVRILSRVPDEGELWLLTRVGNALDSQRLAGLLGERRLHAARPLVFAIGGAFGFGPAVRGRAVRAVSLSRMTLPHEMARLVLAEQLYRAGTILRGEPYHKGGAG